MLIAEKPHGDTARCLTSSIRDRGLCATASGAAGSELQRLSRFRSVAADETIMAENGEASVVGNVVAGVLRLTKTLPDGRQTIVGLVHPGEFFGRPFSDITEFAYEAATDAELCVVDRRAFDGVVRRYPELLHELLLTTLGDLAFARERMLLLGCQSTLERVATFLLVMLERREQLFAGVATDRRVRIAVSTITRRDLASYLSTTIETISRHIHELARRGIIRIIDSSRFEILSYERLLAESGLAEDDLALFSRRRSSRPQAAPRPRLVTFESRVDHVA